MQDIFIKSSSKKKKKREREKGRPSSGAARSLTICACSADSAGRLVLVLAVVVGLPEKEAFLKVSALRFCGRHAGDQGSERTDRAGLEPPGSLGAPLFNHSAAKQSDGELHMPLVSPRFSAPRSSSLSFCLPHISAILRMLLLISGPSLLIWAPRRGANPSRRRRGLPGGKGSPSRRV